MIKKLDFPIPDPPMGEIFPNIYETEFVRAREAYDDFIFEIITPYCNKVSQQKISKEILRQALIEYFKNHPEEQEHRSLSNVIISILMEEKEPVVRCKDCKNWVGNGADVDKLPYWLPCKGEMRRPDYFCADGERR